MKAIITGATGGLGRNLLEFLVLQNWQVVAFGRDEKIGKSLGVEFYAFDLSNFEQTKKISKRLILFFIVLLYHLLGENMKSFIKQM